MTYESVIFDLDGTLIDTIRSLQYAVNIVMEKCGYPKHTYESVRSFINYGSVELIRRSLPESMRTESEVMRVHEIYMPILIANAAHECIVYDGISELCKKLSASGVKIAVLTNKPDSAAKLCINTCLPDVEFLTVRGMVPDKFVKPDRAFTEDVMREISASPESTLFVGDSVVDVKTAHNAGLPCAGVCWGFHGENGFAPEVPDFKVHTPKELEYSILGSI